MFMFILGLFVGASIAIAICAFCMMARAGDQTDLQCEQKTGDSNARNK